MSESKRLQILGMIERGEITADEGLRLLQETNHLDEVPTSYEAPPENREPPEVGAPPAGESSSAADDHFGSGIEIAEALPAEEPFFEQEDNGYEGAEEAQYSSGDPAQSFPADAEKWRRWWMIPLWIGVGIVVISGLFMLWAFQASVALGSLAAPAHKTEARAATAEHRYQLPDPAAFRELDHAHLRALYPRYEGGFTG
jgi:hypothetical protein